MHVDTIPLLIVRGFDGAVVTLGRRPPLLLLADAVFVDGRCLLAAGCESEVKGPLSSAGWRMKYAFDVSDGSGSRWWVKVEGPLAVAAETTSPSKDLLTQHHHAADIVINYRTCTTSINK